jgi:hypothetical protein
MRSLVLLLVIPLFYLTLRLEVERRSLGKSSDSNWTLERSICAALSTCKNSLLMTFPMRPFSKVVVTTQLTISLADSPILLRPIALKRGEPFQPVVHALVEMIQSLNIACGVIQFGVVRTRKLRPKHFDLIWWFPISPTSSMRPTMSATLPPAGG